MTTEFLPRRYLPVRGVLSDVSRRRFLQAGSMALALRAADMSAAGLLVSPPTTLDGLCLSTSQTIYPALLQRFIAKLDPDADDFICEQHAAAIEQVFSAWSAALSGTAGKTERNLIAVRKSLAETVQSNAMKPSEIVPLRTTGPV